jgi:tRNA(fMet)-specific endonuclease VapC
MLKYLLDTDIVLYVMKRRPLGVLAMLNQHAERVAISVVTLAELYHGAEKSQRVAQNLTVIEDFSSRLEVLPYPAAAAQHYGSIRNVLEKAGQSIGVNALHIAAHARCQGLVVVTNNLSEFQRVPGLLVENWVLPSH